MITDVTAGWTQRLGPFTLRVNNVPLDLTGYNVTLVLRRLDGTQAPPGGAVVVTDQSATPGVVYYDPAPTDFVWDITRGPDNQPHTMHWRVIDGAGKVVYFPNGEADLIGVHRP